MEPEQSEALVQSTMEAVASADCLTLDPAYHHHFVVELAQKLFDVVMMEKARSMVDFSAAVAEDAETVKTEDDLTAYLGGAVLSSLVHGGMLHSGVAAWWDVGLIASAFSTEDLDKSGLSSEQLDWLQRQSRGGLLAPLAAIMPIFQELDGRLSQMSLIQLSDPAVWDDVQSFVRQQIQSICSSQDLDFASEDPFGAFAKRFTAVYSLLTKKAAAKASTAQHATAEPGAGPVALRQSLASPPE